MKKMLGFLLVIALMLSMNGSTFRADTGNERIIKKENYSFTISERTDDKKQIIRSYETDKSKKRMSYDLKETETLLLSLGMEEESVDNLSEETLQEFADGIKIVVTTSYTKTDESNNTTYLDEATALQDVEKLKQQDEIGTRVVVPNIGENTPDYENYIKDSYMKLVYAVSYKGNGEYFYSVDATWLKMPFFRGTDSIGACTMNSTVTNSTRQGYYSYDMTWNNHGNVNYYSYKYDITDFRNAVNGNWYGSCGVFELPVDANSDNSSVYFTNFKAHYQYKGHVTYPNEESWFNSIGSYTHSTVSFSIDPSVSIELGGAVTASIGLDVLGDTDVRSAEVEIHYEP